MNKQKLLGEVFTPTTIVTNMLNLVGYNSPSILKRHIIDNSCGEGAFLTEIVKRYCKELFKTTDQIDIIKAHLETYIHGIEIQYQSVKTCIKKLDDIAAEYGVYDVNWDIICDNAFSVTRFNGKMDYVVGNPPYVRIHNMQSPEDIPYKLSGMTDLYIAFYYLGIDMMSSTGQLCYITPNSMFNSKAAFELRKRLIEDNLIETVVNYKDLDVFNAKTYSAIISLRNNKNDIKVVKYYEPENINDLILDAFIMPEEFYINGNFYFKNNKEIKQIFNSDSFCGIRVFNGFATMCDKVFIGNFDFKSPLLIPIIKSSKGVILTAIYPYTKQNKLLSEEDIRKDTLVYNYLMNNQEKLLKRNTTEPWYGYGRTQALKTTFQDKLTVNTYIKNIEDIKVMYAPSGTGAYSGLIITSDKISLSDIKEILETREFCDYVKGLGHYKNGGYCTFNSKELEQFLNYKFTKSTL